MEVQAVVVTYNRKELLIECVNAILKQSKSVKKLIIIDNNSTDGTYQELLNNKIIENQLVVYKKLEKNIGGAGGFYEGIKESLKIDSDFVWIMDDDTIPNVDCLENLLKSYEILKKSEKEKVSFLASSIYGMNGEYMNVPTVDVKYSNDSYPDWYKHLADGLIKIKEATFVSLLINKEAIKEVGFPCKNFFIWGDDIEYTNRLTKYFGEAYMVGNSIAIHKRKNAKPLSIETEENENRIKMYFYKYRNELMVTKEYKSAKQLLKDKLENRIQILKLMFKPNIKYRLKKIYILNKGINRYYFDFKFKKEFKNRTIGDKKEVL